MDLPATLTFDQREIHIRSEGQTFGNWPLADFEAEREEANEFKLVIGGEAWKFAAEDPAHFMVTSMEILSERPQRGRWKELLQRVRSAGITIGAFSLAVTTTLTAFAAGVIVGRYRLDDNVGVIVAAGVAIVILSLIRIQASRGLGPPPSVAAREPERRPVNVARVVADRQAASASERSSTVALPGPLVQDRTGPSPSPPELNRLRPIVREASAVSIGSGGNGGGEPEDEMVTPEPALDEIGEVAPSLDEMEVPEPVRDEIEMAASLDEIETPTAGSDEMEVPEPTLEEIEVVAASLDQVETPATGPDEMEVPEPVRDQIEVVAASLEEIEPVAPVVDQEALPDLVESEEEDQGLGADAGEPVTTGIDVIPDAEGEAQETAGEPPETDGEVDLDLSAIKGIGPTFARRLNDLGVLDLRDLADLDDEGVAILVEYLGRFGKRVLTEDWVGQARRHLERS